MFLLISSIVPIIIHYGTIKCESPRWWTAYICTFHVKSIKPLSSRLITILSCKWLNTVFSYFFSEGEIYFFCLILKSLCLMKPSISIDCPFLADKLPAHWPTLASTMLSFWCHLWALSQVTAGLALALSGPVGFGIWEDKIWWTGWIRAATRSVIKSLARFSSPAWVHKIFRDWDKITLI